MSLQDSSERLEVQKKITQENCQLVNHSKRGEGTSWINCDYWHDQCARVRGWRHHASVSKEPIPNNWPNALSPKTELHPAKYPKQKPGIKEYHQTQICAKKLSLQDTYPIPKTSDLDNSPHLQSKSLSLSIKKTCADRLGQNTLYQTKN